MTTEKTKRNPDFGASAVDLSNPPEVKEKLEHRIGLQKTIADLENLLQSYPEWQQLQDTRQGLAALDKDLYILIDKVGGYQDQEKGIYALKQIRVSKSYDPVRFRTLYPQHADAAIIETVNVPVLSGLIKGGLVTEDKLEPCVIRKETEAYIIRT